MSKPCWIYTTTKDMAEAEVIAETLVDEKLAACANIFPQMRAIYRWQGKMQKESECAVIFKTTDELFDKVRVRIRELHSYETLCIVEIPWGQSDSDYLAWMKKELS